VRSPVLFLALLAFGAVPLAAQGPGALDLRVTDADAGTPLSHAQVGVRGVHALRVTDDSGHTHIDGLAAGPQYVQVRRLGYRTAAFVLNLVPGQVLGVDLELLPSPVELAAVTASAMRTSRTLNRAGFYDRMQAGLGQYLTREDLDRKVGMPVHEIFRGMRGVTVAQGNMAMGDPAHIVVSSRSHGVHGEAPCTFAVYMDGVLQGDVDVDHLSTQDLEGVEVITDLASIPPQYNRLGSACGVILLWTKESNGS
jgi:hypothetical protein